MAVKAEFVGDFSKFTDAVDEATVTLKTFGEGAATVQDKLQRMSDSLTGKTMIQNAMLMAQAVENVGGTAALTEKQLESLGNKAAEAVEKMQRLGMDVPANLQAIADHAKQAEDNVGGLGDVANELVGKLLAWETVKEAIDFTKEAIADTAALVDMSHATGIGIEQLQELKIVGEEAGVGFDTITRAVMMLSDKVANDDTSAKSAIEGLGLSMKDLKAMSPGDMFVAVVTAASQLENPMTKNRDLTDAFGARVARLIEQLPDLKKAMDEVKNTQPMLSDTDAQKAKEFSVWIEQLTNKAKVYTVEAVNWIASLRFAGVATDEQAAAIKRAGINLDELNSKQQANHEQNTTTISDAQHLQNQIGKLTEQAVGLTQAQQAQALAWQAINMPIKDIAANLGVTEAAVKSFLDAQKKLDEEADKQAKAWADLMTVGTSYKDTLGQMDQGTRQVIEALLAQGASMQSLTTIFGLSASQVKAFNDETKETSAVLKQAQEDAQKTAEVWNQYYEHLGDGATTAYQKAIAAADKWAADQYAKFQGSAADWDAFITAVEARYQQMVQAAGVNNQTLSAGLKQNLTDALTVAQNTLDAMQAEWWKYSDASIQAQQKVVDAAKAAVADASAATVAYVGQSVSELQQVGTQAVQTMLTIQGASAAASAALSSVMKQVSQSNIGMSMAQGAGLGRSATDTANQYEALINQLMAQQGFSPTPQAVPTLPGRATGGPVTAGQPYIVGEEGQELFVPSQSGMILPHGITMNINGSVLSDEQKIAKAVGAAIIASLKSQGVRLNA